MTSTDSTGVDHTKWGMWERGPREIVRRGVDDLRRARSFEHPEVLTCSHTTTRVPSYVQEAAGTGGSADEIAKLAKLRNDGVVTQQEFDQQKLKLLA
jgi:hypothetical protein